MNEKSRNVTEGLTQTYSYFQWKLVARNGKLVIDLQVPKRSSVLSSKLKCKLTTKEDFLYKVSIKQGTAKVLAMNAKGPFVLDGI